MIATLEAQVPAPIKLVDHALSRVARKGCLAVIDVTGPENTEVFNAMSTPAEPADTGGEFDGWFSDVDNFDGVVDETGSSTVQVDVGSRANGGAFGFTPAAVKVRPGTTVEWRWVEGMHNVEAEDGSFKSQMTDAAGHTFAQIFDATGVYQYFCLPHKAMGIKGAIVVE